MLTRTVAIIHNYLLFINRVDAGTRPTSSQCYFVWVCSLWIEIALRYDAHVAAGSFHCNRLLWSVTLECSAWNLLISLWYQPIEASCGRVQLFHWPGAVRGVVFADTVFGSEGRRLIRLVDNGTRLMGRKVILCFLQKSSHSVFYLRSGDVLLSFTTVYLAWGQVCTLLLIIWHWGFAHQIFFNCLETFVLF